MSIEPQQILTLPVDEQLQIVEMIWDNLGHSCSPIPLPEWVKSEANRRREEMLADPSLGASHEQVWDRIRQRNG